MTETSAYPLTWPKGTPRTPDYERQWGPFRITPDQATQDLLHEIDLLGSTDVIISSNVKLRRDGFPYARQGQPDDPGVAVYFTLDGASKVFPCDCFDKVWKNIRAIGRYNTHMMEQAFTGFTALPSPQMSAALGWREAFGFEPSDRTTLAQVKKKFHHQAKMHHPDNKKNRQHPHVQGSKPSLATGQRGTGGWP